MTAGQTTELQRLLDRLRGGDPAARDELIERAGERFRRIARKQLKRFPKVRRWEDTDDVFQNAMLRILRALKEVTPETVRHFINLASMHIRRELIDLARHYQGPQGMAAHYKTPAPTRGSHSTVSKRHNRASSSAEPGRSAEWSEFHRKIDELPEQDREMFNLLWYQQLSTTEAAELLNVNVRAVQRRWAEARLKLREALGGEMPR